ncbi:hypothetical protein SDC9_162709 [bioreactor metagenome]|uniref:Uncharacterized protein n=1 Tax=bioreactor metagenome TaxID=1076179 RepID=A0A645FLT7_9ZZZZ
MQINMTFAVIDLDEIIVFFVLAIIGAAQNFKIFIDIIESNSAGKFVQKQTITGKIFIFKI